MNFSIPLVISVDCAAEKMCTWNSKCFKKDYTIQKGIQTFVFRQWASSYST